MPKTYELFGYPIADDSPKATAMRKKAFCPFVPDICDGGGNRFMSDIDLGEHPDLGKMFPSLTHVPSGVCSIQVSDGS